MHIDTQTESLLTVDKIVGKQIFINPLSDVDNEAKFCDPLSAIFKKERTSLK